MRRKALPGVLDGTSGRCSPGRLTPIVISPSLLPGGLNHSLRSFEFWTIERHGPSCGRSWLLVLPHHEETWALISRRGFERQAVTAPALAIRGRTLLEVKC